MIAEPPEAAPATHVTAISASPATPVTLTGALGTMSGVVALDDSNAVDVPTELMAEILKLYPSPFVNPVAV